MSELEQLPPGLPRLINGRYEVHSLIGRGGMADVYLAVDQILARNVAVKVLRPDTANNPMVVNRFRREAKAVAGLSHPNIVAVFDTGELPAADANSEQLPFMVMEYVTGRTLKQVVADGDVDQQRAVELMRGVCDALDHSHSKNVVHRDIKPANVMVTDAGHVKLMDFGIAQALDNSATMTQTAAVVGTAQYFSPEQARGEQVDYRSDIYSAGCLFYELLTHKPPFTGDSPVSVAYQHVGEDPVPPSEANSQVDTIYDAVVLKALAKDRDERFQSAGAFADALEDAAQGIEYVQHSVPTYTMPIYGSHDSTETVYAAAAPMTDENPVFASHDEVPEPPRRKSNRALIVLLSIIALVAVGIAGFVVFNSYKAEQARNAPVEVPQVAGKSEDDAKAILLEASFRANVQQEFSDDVDEGKVTRTDPAAGTKIRQESTIDLYISKGSEQRTIPKDIANQSEAAARDALRAAGLEVGEVSRENSATVPTDWVIGTTPELGSKVKAGTKVDLILSTGQVTVPEVVNMSKDEASKLLEAEDVKLQVQFVDVETGAQEPGTLFEQDPAAGTDVAQGSLVKISVAVPLPEPTPSPTPTPTPSPTDESSNSIENPAAPGPTEDSSNKGKKENSGNGRNKTMPTDKPKDN
ncbi:putative serine/threonine-protein kinase PknB [Glutamicibacter uratoxydans]|uniref:non-specific serine/threonine protein kinase n=1 Tax=Glutamicibacter uratoxydans TaxID=43667 RepID=A0A4Y4DQ24_GLUUR|nr:Stk1 family PASTA domain-containing Ser/Thr kinase [Glutamicibacter uratoxydans]GED06004.1 putative serine/threonine-protein kinase PknB [Glutamicibacter uratoxydans]